MKSFLSRPAGLFASLSLILSPVPSLAWDGAASAQLPPQAESGPIPTKPPATPLNASRGWFYENSDIPTDPEWKFGSLPNGLRYAIRNGDVPPGQISIRIRIDAGSLMEQDSERGYAHFIEHMSFRGSTYVPDGEAKRIWQRLGASFGSDTNASTTPVSTTYKLDLPSAKLGGVDESLKILFGMMSSPNFTESSVNAERGVVLAEERESKSPEQRMGDATRNLFFSGQLLAERSPIGTVKTLQDATPASLRAFHDRWYRPDRTVIIISGNFDADNNGGREVDVQEIAPLIAKNFGTWAGKGANPADPSFGLPDMKAPRVSAIVEPTLPFAITIGTVRPWRWKADTVAYNEGLMTDRIALAIINRKLESKARAGGSFLFAQVSRDDISRTVDMTSIQLVPLGNDWKKAIADVRTVIEEALVEMPTQADIDREATETEQALVTAVSNAPAEPAADQADNVVFALDIGETTTNAAGSLEVFRSAKPKFTPDAILATTKKLFTGSEPRIMISSPTPVANVEGEAIAALDSKISIDPSRAREKTASVSFDQLPSLGKPGTVTSSESIEQTVRLPIEIVRLSNGNNLVLFPNDAESGRIYVDVRFGRGMQQLAKQKGDLAWSGPAALVSAGLANLNLDQLDRLTTGRQIGMNFAVENDSFSISATTRPDDLPDQLRIIATKLTHPSWDKLALERAKQTALAGYDGRDNSAFAVINTDLEGIMRGGDKRWTAPSREAINALTPKAFEAYWKPVLASGPIEIMIFGDFKRDEAVKAALETFGAMKPRKDAGLARASGTVPTFTPNQEANPAVRTHSGPDDQAAAVRVWKTGGGLATIEESYKLEVLAEIFGDRLLDQLRTTEGESYSPVVFRDWPVDITNGGTVTVLGQVRPGSLGRFFAITDSIAADLAANPVSEDEFGRAVQPVLERYNRAFTGNTFWMRNLKGVSFNPEVAIALGKLPRALRYMRASDVQLMAQKYLVPGNEFSWVIRPAKAAGGS